MQRVVLRIKGQVQGVFYRVSAQEEAKRLGIVGLARNEVDGSVLIEAEGEPDKLKAFVAWCRKGPDTASVEDIEIREIEPRGDTLFDVH